MWTNVELLSEQRHWFARGLFSYVMLATGFAIADDMDIVCVVVGVNLCTLYLNVYTYSIYIHTYVLSELIFFTTTTTYSQPY